MRIWKIAALLALFGVTLFFAVVLTITVGVQNPVQFVLAWAAVFAVSGLSRVPAYSMAALAGAFLAIPASMYVYLPERGGITVSKFFWENFVRNFSSARGYIGLLLYVLVLCASLYLIRGLQAAQVSE